MENCDFDLTKFLTYIRDGKLKKAFHLKDHSIPKTLYKFYHLFNPPICSECNYEKICFCEKCNQKKPCNFLINNGKKIDTVENNQLWLSRVDEYNDPFEFRSVYPDKSRSNGNEELTLELLSYLKNQIRISCFVGREPIHEMPMWAHYANNHQGFCIEYAVINSANFYPIQYSSERIPIATIPSFIFSSISKAISEDQKELDQKSQANIIYLILSAMVKSKHWEYENEYRIIYQAQKPEENGENVKLVDLGLEMKQIYIGKSCCKKNRVRLIEIAKKNNLPINEIFLDEYISDYKLSSRLI